LRLNGKKYLVMFAFSLITVPVCAAQTDSASWEPTQPMTIGGAPVNPGHYRLKADEDLNELRVMESGKVIATVLCYWKDLPKKAASTEIKVNNNQVTEVQFKGSSEAVIFF
jgi:hypothetical protein